MGREHRANDPRSFGARAAWNYTSHGYSFRPVLSCTDFRKPGSQDEYYDIDFWVDQKSGKLEVKDVKMHKVPVQEDGIWTQVPRYTFDGMDFDVTN
jgi:hypothetical protein